jgi:hypothetical protein
MLTWSAMTMAADSPRVFNGSIFYDREIHPSHFAAQSKLMATRRNMKILSDNNPLHNLEGLEEFIFTRNLPGNHESRCYQRTLAFGLRPKDDWSIS